jgi:hypothetical protein
MRWKNWGCPTGIDVSSSTHQKNLPLRDEVIDIVHEFPEPTLPATMGNARMPDAVRQPDAQRAAPKPPPASQFISRQADEETYQ